MADKGAALKLARKKKQEKKRKHNEVTNLNEYFKITFILLQQFLTFHHRSSKIALDPILLLNPKITLINLPLGNKLFEIFEIEKKRFCWLICYL